MATEFDKINEYVYNKFDKLIVKYTDIFTKDMSYEKMYSISRRHGFRPEMMHDPSDQSVDIISVIRKFIIDTPSHTQKLYNDLAYMPMLINPMTDMPMSKRIYYDAYIKHKLQKCYDEQNKQFIDALLEAIQQDETYISLKHI
jgi:hypothetical protein